MKPAVIGAGLAQMVAIGVGAGVGKLMGMALLPWEWLGIVVVVPLLSLLYGAMVVTDWRAKSPRRPKQFLLYMEFTPFIEKA